MDEIRYPMRLVTQRTGLSSHVVRVWERRYGAVTPDRSGTNRRLYSDEDIHRLSLMARLTREGHGIGQIARLATAELEQMADGLPIEVPADPAAASSADVNGHGASGEIDGFMELAWRAISVLDSAALQGVLEDASKKLGGSSMIEKLIVPLTARIGSAWDSGEISVAQERAASTVIQEVLLIAGRPHSESSGAPNLLVATPTGQLHELGAALVVCIARRRGWSVTYLGASIPADEVAHAAKLKNSIGVALSLVYPGDDPTLPKELRRLRRLLDDGCEILVGGRAAPAYGRTLAEIGARQFAGLDDLKGWLDDQRSRREQANRL